MRPVSLFIATSLDGYIAREDGSVDWLFSDQDYGYSAFYERVDTVLMGRHTWQQVQQLGAYPYAGKPGIVFSHALSGTDDPDVQVVVDPVDTWLREHKQAAGGTIWLVGGAKLVDSCLQADLIDEFILSIHPVILGDGIPLFRPGHRTLPLTLIHQESFDTGLIQLTYQRPRE
ncbi:dihydrofolate reductase [Chitinivorax tropicus]|uniref:Dihydrofolate reductase n=1 Tax=Chitinivorax tropicus TaxID=714531 RepID=A0A840MLK0_9PROT|nr:dihydrofolate reductase family protein [Chitinivorax tropicus]MBB5019518.1 dihydrofolate reductase [Chitinivorax tropicus]